MASGLKNKPREPVDGYVLLADSVTGDPRMSIIVTVVFPPAFFPAIHPAHHFYVAITFAFLAATLRYAPALVCSGLGLIHTTWLLFL